MQNRCHFGLTVMLILCCFKANAQRLDNKLNVYIGYTTGSFLGPGYIDKGSFSFPSFYNNMNSLNGVYLQCSYNVHDFISLGFIAENLTTSNWLSDQRFEYRGAEATILSFSPMVQLHSPFEDEGIFNKLKIHLDLAVNLGNSAVELESDLSEQTYEDTILLPTQTSGASSFYGIQGGLSLDYSLTYQIGAFINYSLSHNWVTSNMYLDQSFSYSKFTFGIYLKFLRDKKYYY